jgi:hypothetical protein
MIMSHKPIRLLLGGDNAGFDYQDAILADMQSDERVEVVEDLANRFTIVFQHVRSKSDISDDLAHDSA